MTQNAGVSQIGFGVVTITADAAAVTLGDALAALQTLPSGPLAWLSFSGDVILYLGTPNTPPTSATTWTLAGNTFFNDVSSGIPSDPGPSLYGYSLYSTGAGNCTVKVSWRTR